MANIANINVSMNLRGRPALYTPPVDRPRLGLEKGATYDVDVLGLYQVVVDTDVDAYFVVVLPDGKCTYAGVDQIQFTDCDEPEDGEEE